MYSRSVIGRLLETFMARRLTLSHGSADMPKVPGRADDDAGQAVRPHPAPVESAWYRGHSRRCCVVAAAAVVLAVMLLLGGLMSTLAVLTSLGLFITPGIFLWRILEPRVAPAGPLSERLAIGAVLGIGLSATITVLVSLPSGFAPVSATVVLGGLSIVLAAVGRGRAVSASAPALPGRPTGVAGIACALVIAVSVPLSVAFASFGRLTAHGVAFSKLQKTDLVHHMATAVELTRGIPPSNPYFSGEVLHYFWWAHVLPAFANALSGYRSPPGDIIVLTALAYSILTVLAVLATLHALYADRRVLWLLMTLTVLANGYSGLFVLAQWLMEGLPGSGPGGMVQRLFTDDWGEAYTGYSHGFFRSFLVEPQSTLAIAMLAVLVTLGVRYGFFGAPTRVALVQGTLLGWSVVTDTFLGLLVGVAWAIGGMVESARGPGRRMRVVGSLGAIGLAASSVLGLMLLLHMVEPGHRTLLVRPYTTLILLAPAYFLIDYGPLAVAGVAGLIGFLRDRRGTDETIRFFCVLMVVCLAAMFFVSHVQVGTQVFRKAGLVLRLPLAALSGRAIAEILQGGRRWLRGLLLIGVAGTLPTVATDVGRITGLGPVPDHMYYVSSDDAAAYAWMKRHLATTVLVQDLPGEFSGIVALAERRTALGDWVHAVNYQVGEERVSERHRDIYRTLFLGRDARLAHEVATKYAIDYVYVGREAREKVAPEALDKFERCEGYFEGVYRRDGVVVYRVRPSAVTPKEAGCR